MEYRRFIIGKNRHFCDFLIVIDSKGRPSLKFSFPIKIKSFNLFAKIKRPYLIPEKMICKKIIDQGASLEISYKSLNKKLELKHEIKDGSIERILYDVDIPTTCPLFEIRISNIEILPIITPKISDIMLTLGNGNNFILVFSFEDKNGNFWDDVLMKGKTGKKMILDLPNFSPEKICIISTPDDGILRSPGGFGILIPHKVTKITT